MEQKKLDRIGELSRKQRSVGLSEEEKAEQAALRQEYIRAIRESFIGTMENTYIMDEQGNKRKVTRHSKSE